MNVIRSSVVIVTMVCAATLMGCMSDSSTGIVEDTSNAPPVVLSNPVSKIEILDPVEKKVIHGGPECGTDQQFRIDTRVRLKDGSLASDQTVRFVPSVSGIIDVDNTTHVATLSKARGTGTVIFTVSSMADQSVSATTVPVVVDNESCHVDTSPRWISLLPSSGATCKVGSTMKLDAFIYPWPFGYTVRWETSNPAVARIDFVDALLGARLACVSPGAVDVAVSANALSARSKYTVVP